MHEMYITGLWKPNQGFPAAVSLSQAWPVCYALL